MQLAWPFTDHMIFHRDMPVPVWGRAPLGAKVTVAFDHADGLKSSDGQAVRGFVIADSSGTYHLASTETANNTITLSSLRVAVPVRVRYAWQPFSNANLVNRANLPAFTFELSEPRNLYD